MKMFCRWKLFRTTRRFRIRSPFVHHTPLTYRTRNFPPPAPLPENTKHREYFPGCFPPSPVSPTTALGHTEHRVFPCYALWCFVCSIIYCVPSPLLLSDRPRDCRRPLVRLWCWRPLSLARATRQAPPPLITRYHLLFSILLALE